jgi:hypothetical protein
MFIFCGLFFLCALGFQLRHDFSTQKTRDAKIEEFDSKLIDAELSPIGHRTNEEIYRSLVLERQNLLTKAQGKLTGGSILYNDWLEEQKKSDMPIVMFLYGAAILFLFGAIMKSKSIESKPKADVSAEK